MSSIDAIRGGEIKVLRWIAKLWALANFTFSSVPFLMTLATFLTFIYRWHPITDFPGCIEKSTATPQVIYCLISWQRPGKEQADSRLDLHLPLPLQPHQNSPHPLSFCTDGHNQALCQVAFQLCGDLLHIFFPVSKESKTSLMLRNWSSSPKTWRLNVDKINNTNWVPMLTPPTFCFILSRTRFQR